MNNYTKQAFSLVEAVVAISIFAVVAVALITLATGGLGGFDRSDQTLAAENLAGSSLEIVRQMADKAWNNVPVGSGTLVKQAGEYVFSSQNEAQEVGEFARLVNVEYGCRAADGSIVDCSAGDRDANLKKVTATISWQDPYRGLAEAQRITYLANWQSTDWLQTDWNGGDNQLIWSDETKFYIQGNLDYEEPGELSLALLTPECQGFDWDFLDKNNYIYNNQEITVADSLATAEPPAPADPFALLSQDKIANRYEILQLEKVDSDTIVTMENYTWQDSCSIATYNYVNNKFVEIDRMIIDPDRLCNNYDLANFAQNRFMMINAPGTISTIYIAFVSDNGDIGQDWVDVFEIPATTDQPARYRLSPDLFAISPGVVGLTYLTSKGSWPNKFFEAALDVFYLDSSFGIYSFVTETDFSDRDAIPRMKPYDLSQNLWVYLAADRINESISLTPFEMSGAGEIISWGETYDAGGWNDITAVDEFYFDSLGDDRLLLANTTDQGTMIKTFQLSSGSPLRVESQIDSWLMDDDQWLLPAAKLSDNTYALPTVDRNTYLSLLQLNNDGTINKSVLSQQIGRGTWWDVFDSLSLIEDRIVIPNGGTIYYYEADAAAAGSAAYSIEPNEEYYLEEGSVLSGFIEVADKQNGEIYYQLSDDGGATWYYWNGSSWQAANDGDYNTAEVINTHISDFNQAATSYKFKAWLAPADGPVSLDLVSMACEQIGSTGRQTDPLLPVWPGDDPIAGGDSEYYLSGSLTSSARLLEPEQTWQMINWRGEIPDDTAIRFQVRGAPDNNGSPGAWSDWYGAAGIGSYFDNAGGSDLPQDVSGYDWLQYRLELSGSGETTPVLYEVVINYQ